MKPNIEHSFIHFVYSKARESESLDINNQRKSFVRRNVRFLLAYPLTVIVLFRFLKDIIMNSFNWVLLF